MNNQAIYQELREDILTCALAPGVELREQELAQRFSVSKSPVREALQQLVHDGLIVVQPRQGYRVSAVSVAGAQDLFGLRRALELASIEAAAREGDMEKLKALDRFRTFEGGDETAFINYNREFHCAAAMCSGNDRMGRVTCDVIEEMDRPIRLSVSAVRGRNPEKLVAEHCAIIDALQERDPKRAVRLLRSHIRSAEKRFLSALQWAAVQS